MPQAARKIEETCFSPFFVSDSEQETIAMRLLYRKK